MNELFERSKELDELIRLFEKTRHEYLVDTKRVMSKEESDLRIKTANNLSEIIDFYKNEKELNNQKLREAI